MSASSSSPEHSWKPPSPSRWVAGLAALAPGSRLAGPPAALRVSETLKRNVRTRNGSGTGHLLHSDAAVAVAGHAQHEELQRLGRRDPDLDQQPALLQRRSWVEVVAAADEERLLLGGAREGAALEQQAQQ